MKKIWDVVLFPSKLYEKITDNKVTLAAGVVLIGLIDFFLPDVKSNYKLYFTGKPAGDIQFNIALAVLMVLLLGVIDILFFSLPLFDIFKFFKKKEGLTHRVTPIKVAKVYIMSHFLIVPVNTALYFLLFRDVTKDSSVMIMNLSVALLFIIIIWSSALITRGINSLFSFGPFIRRLTFLIVFIWNYLFSMVFDMQIMTWLFKIFK